MTAAPRRRAGAPLLVALLALALLASTASVAPSIARADQCVWQKHTKRVVRHVRRHGQRRRIVRLRHWWTCEPVTPPQPARLGVRALEFTYLLSRTHVAAGEIIVELNNQGEDPHNLNIAPLSSPESPLVSFEDLESLQRTSKRFSLDAGSYRLWCSLPEHATRGMESTLTVDPAS